MSSEKILFVDDESLVLDGLRRALRHRRREWVMAFAGSGEEALDMLDEFKPTVVVSDMRMPGLDGAALLMQVKERHPGTVRFVLSGNADTEAIMRAVGPSHQYLSKPCETIDLDNAIARTRALRQMLNSEQLVSRLSAFDELPSLPSTYQRLIDTLKSEDASVRDVSAIISSDIAMTAKILKLVNSAYFGIPRHISDIEKAVGFLGIETIASLVLGHGAFSALKPVADSTFDFEATMSLAMRTAAAARAVARIEGVERRIANDAFMAGMLGYLGEIIVAASMPEMLVEVAAFAEHEDVPADEAQLQVAGARFDEMGAYLMGLWSLPDTIVEAAAYRRAPSRSPVCEISALAIAHIAYCVCHADDADVAPAALDAAYLDQLEIKGSWREWYSAVKQTMEDAA